MTKIVSPCEIALFGHSGSQAPQLMQSLVIIVAISVGPPATWVEVKSGETNSILNEILRACKSTAADLNVHVKLGMTLDFDQFNFVAVGGLLNGSVVFAFGVEGNVGYKEL